MKSLFPMCYASFKTEGRPYKFPKTEDIQIITANPPSEANCECPMDVFKVFIPPDFERLRVEFKRRALTPEEVEEQEEEGYGSEGLDGYAGSGVPTPIVSGFTRKKVYPSGHPLILTIENFDEKYDFFAECTPEREGNQYEPLAAASFPYLLPEVGEDEEALCFIDVWAKATDGSYKTSEHFRTSVTVKFFEDDEDWDDEEEELDEEETKFEARIVVKIGSAPAEETSEQVPLDVFTGGIFWNGTKESLAGWDGGVLWHGQNRDFILRDPVGFDFAKKYPNGVWVFFRVFTPLKTKLIVSPTIHLRWSYNENYIRWYKKIEARNGWQANGDPPDTPIAANALLDQVDDFKANAKSILVKTLGATQVLNSVQYPGNESEAKKSEQSEAPAESPTASKKSGAPTKSSQSTSGLPDSCCDISALKDITSGVLSIVNELSAMGQFPKADAAVNAVMSGFNDFMEGVIDPALDTLSDSSLVVSCLGMMDDAKELMGELCSGGALGSIMGKLGELDGVLGEGWTDAMGYADCLIQLSLDEDVGNFDILSSMNDGISGAVNDHMKDEAKKILADPKVSSFKGQVDAALSSIGKLPNKDNASKKVKGFLLGQCGDSDEAKMLTSVLSGDKGLDEIGQEAVMGEITKLTGLDSDDIHGAIEKYSC